MTVVDHVAVATVDLDADVEFFTSAFGMRLVRRGVHLGLGSPIALLRAERGMTLELISVTEPPERGVAHIAVRMADRDAIVAALRDIHPARSVLVVRIDAAAAHSAFVSSPGGIPVQLIAYDPDSADLAEEWG
jgi:catechol 2,3-dioxygenase-like lactoylglutathione lyase family enzyme